MANIMHKAFSHQTVCTKGSHSLNHAEVNHAPGSCSHYGDFVQASFNMEDRTAEFALGVSKASAKAFELRIS